MERKMEDAQGCPTRGGGWEKTAEAGTEALTHREEKREREIRACREELQTAAEDLDNLLAGAEVGVLYLDAKLCVRKVTPVMSRITRILPADLGRPVYHLGFMDSCPLLAEDIRMVTDTLQPTEREVAGPGESTWLVRVRPYRTAVYAVEGVVVTLVENTHGKRLEAALNDATKCLEGKRRQLAGQEELLSLLLEQTASLKLFVDAGKRLQYLNSAARARFVPQEGAWALPVELDDIFELMRGENHLRFCHAVPLEGGAGHRAVADVVAEPSRDREGKLLGVLYTISMEGGA